MPRQPITAALSRMSADPSPCPQSGIINRLRAAGCVFAEDETRLLISAARTPAGLAAMVDRRAAGEPARSSVAPSPAAPQPVVVDLCCGSSAVGAALVAALHRVELYAVDIDPDAVRCAGRNVATSGGQLYQGDLYEPLPRRLPATWQRR